VPSAFGFPFEGTLGVSLVLDSWILRILSDIKSRHKYSVSNIRKKVKNKNRQ
jgi:hypothetical protein